MSVYYELVIQNAVVIDGTGAPAYPADVAISQQKIAAIAPPNTLKNAQHFHYANGLVLTPGFIDVHTHDDRAVLDNPLLWNKLSQGITTVITGNCGISLAPWKADNLIKIPAPLSLIGHNEHFKYPTFSDYLNAVDAAQPAVNVASLVGHSTLRVAYVEDVTRPANTSEIEAMQQALQGAMESGAFGFSSGLFYATSQAAPNTEVIALASCAAKAGGIYTSHIRDEYNGVMESLTEALDAGEAASIPVVLSHHKCAGPANWGRTTETLDYVKQRRKTQWIGMDAYPYTAGSTVLDPNYVDGIIQILISWSVPYPDYAGRDLADIANEWGITQQQAAERLLPAGAVYFQMREDDVQRVLSDPYCMIGSDGLPHDTHPHPRLWGSFPRVLGLYCRDKQLFNLTEAVYKMTGLSARSFGLHQRGRIAVGLAADLVLFNPETIIDTATFSAPLQAANGIEAVWVAGEYALKAGESTGTRNGKALRLHQERYDS